MKMWEEVGPTLTRRETLVALGGVAVGLAPVAASAADGKGAFAKIMQTKVMRVGMALNPPMVLQHTNGSWYGFNPDLVRMLAKSWGVRVEFRGATWATIVPGLLAGKYDFIGASISATPLRKKVINFTTPYFKAGQVYIVNKNKHPRIDSLAALNSPHVTVAFVENTIEGDITRKLLPHAKKRGLLGASIGDLVAEVVSGRAAAFCITSTMRRPILTKFAWARSVPNTDEGVNSTPVAWGVRKEDPDLLAALNKFISSEEQRSAIVALYKKEVTPASADLGT